MEFIIESKKHGAFKVIIDDEDSVRVLEHTWCVSYSNVRGKVRSIMTKVGEDTLYLHSFIMKSKMIDHIDGNIFNNVKANLRHCTNSQNLCNRGNQKNNTSGAKGVVWDKSRGKWSARIKKNSVTVNLGRFVDKSEAIKAYNLAALKIHGEFARLNVVAV
jgi:hypothetical protein